MFLYISKILCLRPSSVFILISYTEPAFSSCPQCQWLRESSCMLSCCKELFRTHLVIYDSRLYDKNCLQTPCNTQNSQHRFTLPFVRSQSACSAATRRLYGWPIMFLVSLERPFQGASSKLRANNSRCLLLSSVPQQRLYFPWEIHAHRGKNMRYDGSWVSNCRWLVMYFSFPGRSRQDTTFELLYVKIWWKLPLDGVEHPFASISPLMSQSAPFEAP